MKIKGYSPSLQNCSARDVATFVPDYQAVTTKEIIIDRIMGIFLLLTFQYYKEFFDRIPFSIYDAQVILTQLIRCHYTGRQLWKIPFPKLI